MGGGGGGAGGGGGGEGGPIGSQLMYFNTRGLVGLKAWGPFPVALAPRSGPLPGMGMKRMQRVRL